MNETLTEAEAIVAERMCIVTREVMDEAQLIRFVRGPDGAVVPDINRKLPGRGVWVSLSRAKVAEAVKCQAFSRGLGEGCSAASDLPDQVGGLIRKAAVSYISLAKKAGEAVAGAAKVENMLAAGRARLVTGPVADRVDRLPQQHLGLDRLPHRAFAGRVGQGCERLF